MKKIGVIANCGKDDAATVLKQLSAKAAELNLELIANEETAPLLPDCATMPEQDLFDAVDTVMALGGDGTMLRVVRELNGRDKPLIGVNLGSLGFMTSVSHEDLDRAMEALARSELVERTRMIAEAAVTTSSGAAETYRALNDVVVGSPKARVITLKVRVDGDRVTSYVCDGLIVSTPTGSTGHSLSAGGPILVPETKAFMITPICPHTLSTRPLVIPDTSEVLIETIAGDGEFAVSVDGQVGQVLDIGDVVTVRISDKRIRFLHLPESTYFGVLRQKLKWRGSNV